jgi:outer membrane protein assembly factor BamB
VTQLATNVIHDMFNEKSVWVSSVTRPRGFEVWGDDTLFKHPQGREGVWVTSETAELSRQALREILDHGGTDITVKSLRDRFPTKAGDSAESLGDLATWNQSLRSLCDRELFGDSWTRFKDLFLTAVPRLSPSSRDEDRVAWSTDLEKSGYYATAVLVDNGHLYAGSNGFIYELDRASGRILHSAVVGARGIAADYLTTLATDGQTLFAGTHGYVYGISLTTWDTLWDAGVGEHGYHHVSVGCHEGQLFAGCNGHVYRIDRTNGKVVGNIDLGGGDQSLNYNGRYLLAGRDDQIAAIAVPDGLHPSRFEVAWQSDFKINHSNGNPMSSVLMGQRLFAASKQLWELDPNTGATVGTYGLDYKEGSGDVRLATDGTRIFAGHGDTVDCTQPGRAGWRTSVASLMTEKGVAGHHPVSILMLNGRLFAGCNGYLYELQPNSGVARQWMRPTDLAGVGDYDTRLATDGTDICLGTHGYVYKVELAKR